MEVHDAGIGVIRYLFFVLNCILLTYSYLNGLLERHFVEEIKKNKYQYKPETIELVEKHWSFALEQWDYKL